MVPASSFWSLALRSPPMDYGALFTPFSCGSLQMANRIVMAPMTRSQSPSGVPSAAMAAYYRRRAANGVGLILSEGTGIGRPSALNDPNVPFFHGQDALAGWAHTLGQVHEAGGRMAPQLWHVGAMPHVRGEWVSPHPVESPSGLVAPGQPLGQAMSDADIADTIAAFAAAAAQAARLGFDAVEIHAAHGYLIDQFFWAGTNLRRGAYGGATLVERARFAADVISAIRAAIPADLPLIVRLSQFKQQDYDIRLAHTPGQMEAWLRVLADAGASLFHCSQRRLWEPEFEGSDLNFAGWAKKLIGLPTISVGSVGLQADVAAAYRGESSPPASLTEVVRRLERGDFDLVAVGRALLQDPQWAAKIAAGRTEELLDFNPESMRILT